MENVQTTLSVIVRGIENKSTQVRRLLHNFKKSFLKDMLIILFRFSFIKDGKILPHAEL